MRPLNVHKGDVVIKATDDLFGEPNTEAHILQAPSNQGPVASVVANSKTRSFKSRQFAEWGRKVLLGKSISSTEGVVLVSYFLPVVISKSPSGRWIATWDDENLLALQSPLRMVRIGVVRYPGGIPVEEEEAVAHVLQELNCYPVFINQRMHQQFYDVFCKQNLWPVLHHVADVYGPLNLNDSNAQAQQDLWFNYTTVNRLFKDKVIEVYQRGDLVWIHGFHLLLLPSFLRRGLPLAKVGLFFHTPFPSSEIWRTMTRREDLLKGMLGADHVGFHLYEYARHFLTTCRRLLGHSYEMSAAGQLSVNVDGRDVSITCIHVGIDQVRVEEGLASSDFNTDVNYWKHKFPNKVVVCGIDRLERLKGIPLKLSAIEQFMDENPYWRSKIVFVIIGITARERGDDYRYTQSDVSILTKRINDKFGNEVVYFEEREDKDMPLRRRLAFFAASHVLMITSPRDGLNRLPMEFTLARSKYGSLAQQRDGLQLEGTGLPSEGLIIISEFISSARVMRGALMVNPWRTVEVTTALKKALEMSRTERADRMRRNTEFSTRLTTNNWAIQVLNDLKNVEKSEDIGAYSALGFGMAFRVMGVKAGFHTLDIVAVSKAYRNARHRLILLDWGGTLVAENDKVDKLHAYALSQGHASRSGPTQALKDALENLCADPKNVVFVVSGKDLRAVSEFFGDVKGLGLGAEHGFYYSWPQSEGCANEMEFVHSPFSPAPSPSPRSQLSASPDPFHSSGPAAGWRTMLNIGDESWKESCMMVMGIYVERTHGTYIEQKGHAVIWQFRDADPEFGFMQSQELEEHLNEIMANHPVEVLRGGGVSDGYIEVRPAGVSKGLFLEHAFSTMKAINKPVDFLMAIGDDASDEPMFDQILRLQQSTPEDLGAYAVTVGKKPSAAQSYVDDPGAVQDLLVTLQKSALRDKRYNSEVNLHSQYPGHPGFHPGFGGLTPEPGSESNEMGAKIVKSVSVGVLSVLTQY